jgi:8-oxo-dGTP pyrophosphatase MutT (NUDIX family)
MKLAEEEAATKEAEEEAAALVKVEADRLAEETKEKDDKAETKTAADEPPTEPVAESPVVPVTMPTISFYTLVELKAGAPGVEYAKREQHLADTEFLELFGMTKENFNKMKLWKRVDAKKKVGLF